jgi:hypothetical protein
MTFPLALNLTSARQGGFTSLVLAGDPIPPSDIDADIVFRQKQTDFGIFSEYRPTSGSGGFVDVAPTLGGSIDSEGWLSTLGFASAAAPSAAPVIASTLDQGVSVDVWTFLPPDADQQLRLTVRSEGLGVRSVDFYWFNSESVIRIIGTMIADATNFLASNPDAPARRALVASRGWSLFDTMSARLEGPEGGVAVSSGPTHYRVVVHPNSADVSIAINGQFLSLDAETSSLGPTARNPVGVVGLLPGEGIIRLNNPSAWSAANSLPVRNVSAGPVLSGTPARRIRDVVLRSGTSTANFTPPAFL